jgi:hypothetical protein
MSNRNSNQNQHGRRRKASVQCPFLKRNGHCLKGSRCDFCITMSYLQYVSRNSNKTLFKELPLLIFHNPIVTKFLFLSIQTISPRCNTQFSNRSRTRTLHHLYHHLCLYRQVPPLIHQHDKKPPKA